MKARTPPAAPIEMIVIGASAGGLDGVQTIVQHLPPSFPACVAIVISPERLEAGQRDAVEGALWSAVRALEEQADLRQRMAERAHGSGLGSVRARFAEAAHESHRQAASIRELLFRRTTPAQEVAAVPQPRRAAGRVKARVTKAAARRRRANGR